MKNNCAKSYESPPAAGRRAVEENEGIDFSDIPELDGTFWRKAALSRPGVPVETVRQANADDERRLSEKRRAADLSFDMRPAAAAADDLDLNYARYGYLPRGVAPEVLEDQEFGFVLHGPPHISGAC